MADSSEQSYHFPDEPGNFASGRVGVSVMLIRDQTGRWVALQREGKITMDGCSFGRITPARIIGGILMVWLQDLFHSLLKAAGIRAR